VLTVSWIAFVASSLRVFDADKNAFIAPKPYASWVLNGVNWEAPKAKPEGNYIWDEEKLDWVEFVIPTLN
jgi:hypothetical protein